MSRTNYTDDQRKNIVKKVEEAYHSSEDVNINNKDNTKSDKKTNTKANNSADEHIIKKRVLELKKERPFLGYIKISKQLKYSYDIKISPRKIKKILAKHNLDENTPGQKKTCIIKPTI